MITRIGPMGSIRPLPQCGEALAPTQIEYVIKQGVTVNALRRHRMKAWPNPAGLAMMAIRRPIFACKYGRWLQGHARFAFIVQRNMRAGDLDTAGHNGAS